MRLENVGSALDPLDTQLYRLVIASIKRTHDEIHIPLSIPYALAYLPNHVFHTLG